MSPSFFASQDWTTCIRSSSIRGSPTAPERKSITGRRMDWLIRLEDTIPSMQNRQQRTDVPWGFWGQKGRRIRVGSPPNWASMAARLSSRAAETVSRKAIPPLFRVFPLSCPILGKRCLKDEKNGPEGPFFTVFL